MNNNEVAHLWANQSRKEAKGSHFYFEGDTIYSYGPHFPIARLFTHPASGKTCVLFTSEGYSVTTTRHKSIVLSACSHLERFTVRKVRASTDGMTAAQFDSMLAQEAKARDTQAEEAKARKSAQAKARRAQAKESKEAVESFNAELAEWRAGGSEPRALRRGLVRGTYLRLIENARYIETSRRAKVPSVIARKAWPILCRAVNQETASPSSSAWVPFFEIPEFQWGDYRGIALRRVALGSPVELVVGCHSIPWAELETIAAEMKLPSPSHFALECATA